MFITFLYNVVLQCINQLSFVNVMEIVVAIKCVWVLNYHTNHATRKHSFCVITLTRVVKITSKKLGDNLLTTIRMYVVRDS